MPDVLSLDGQALDQRRAGKALPGIAIGSRGQRANPLRQRSPPSLTLQAIGAPAMGINDHRLKSMVRVQPLKDQVPERDRGTKKTMIEPPRIPRQHEGQCRLVEQPQEMLQALGGGESGAQEAENGMACRTGGGNRR